MRYYANVFEERERSFMYWYDILLNEYDGENIFILSYIHKYYISGRINKKLATVMIRWGMETEKIGNSGKKDFSIGLFLFCHWNHTSILSNQKNCNTFFKKDPFLVN